MDTVFDVLAIGSITVDFFAEPSESPIITIDSPQTDFSYLSIPVGEKIQIPESLNTCGGCAANTATGFKRLGLEVAAIGVVGDDEKGRYACSEMQKNGINTDYVVVESGKNSSFSIVLTAFDGRRTVLNKQLESELFNSAILNTLPKTKLLYIGHLSGDSQSIMLEIDRYKRDHPEVEIAWNPGKTQFNTGYEAFSHVFPLIDYLILNTEEAEYFTGLKKRSVHAKDVTELEIGNAIDVEFRCMTPKNFSDLRHIAQRFLNSGVKHVVITDGKKGAQWFDPMGNHRYMPTTHDAPVNTLGAGDAFAVGVVSAHLYGESDEQQMLWGSLNASSVVRFTGAQEGLLTLQAMRGKVSKT